MTRFTRFAVIYNERMLRNGILFLMLSLAWPLVQNRALADLIEMQNGDRFSGSVVAISTNTIVLQSDMLGLINLPRGRVGTITMGAVAPTNQNRTNAIARKAAPLIITNTTRPSAVSAPLAGDTNVIKQVEEQLLSGASPEAKAKFNELASGLMNGSVSVADIRKQAKTAADQLRTARQELGPEAGDALDGYLSILESFLRDSEPETAAAAKSPPVAEKPSAK